MLLKSLVWQAHIWTFLIAGHWTSNKDAADHHWKPCRMLIDGNSSNYLKVIDKWQPVVCADVLGEPGSGWDYRLELSTALHARQTIKPFKQFLKGVSIRLQPYRRWLISPANSIKKRLISNSKQLKDFSWSIKFCTGKQWTTKSASPNSQAVLQGLEWGSLKVPLCSICSDFKFVTSASSNQWLSTRRNTKLVQQIVKKWKNKVDSTRSSILERSTLTTTLRVGYSRWTIPAKAR